MSEGPFSTPRTNCPWWMAAPKNPRVFSEVCLILIRRINDKIIYIESNLLGYIQSGKRIEESCSFYFICCHLSQLIKTSQYFSYQPFMSKPNPAYTYPPSTQNAVRHRKANQIFKALTPADTDSCECCSRKLGSGTVSTSCTMDPDQFSFLGPGVPLFFFYLRMSIILFVGMSIIFTSFAVYSNYITNDCKTLQVCAGDVFSLMSLINKRSSSIYMSVQGYLELAFILLVICFFQLIRAMGRKLKQQCDEVVDSPSDYAVILRRLPPNITENDVMAMLEERRKSLTPEQAAQTENLKVVKVVLSYSLRESLDITAQNAENFKQAIKEGKHESFVPQPTPQPSTSSSIAVIIFQHQQSKHFLIYSPTVVQRILQSLCTPCIPISQLAVKGECIGVERAPEPDDICWENSGITMRGAIGRKIGFGSIAVLILCLGGAAQYGLEVLYNSTSSSTVQTFLTISNSFVILIFNSLIMLTLIATTRKQRNQTLTQYQNTLMVKQAVFQFFNAGVFVIGSEVAAKNSTFTLNDGVCQQITAVMAVNCLVPNLTLLLLNYTEVVNKVFILLSNCGCLAYTQKELNDLYLGPVIDLPSKYAYILKIVWLTGLYAPLVPIVVIIAAVGLALNYLVEKVLFTKVYSVPNTVSSMGYENAVELLEYFLLAFGMGQLIVYFYFYSFQISSVPVNWLIFIFLCIGLATLNVTLPMDAINQALFPLPDSAKSETKYSQIEDRFEVTYEMNNPAYKTVRQRRNVKDILGLGQAVEEQAGREIAYEMTNLFTASLDNNATKQPLMQKQPENNITPNQNNIFTSLLKNTKDDTTPNNNSMEKKAKKQAGINDEMNQLSSQPMLARDQRPQLKSIKKQATPNQSSFDPLSKSQTQNLNQSLPIQHNYRKPSSSTANESILKRTFTNQPIRPHKTNTDRIAQRKQTLEDGEGDRFNISILEPPQFKKQKKGPLIPLDSIEDEPSIGPLSNSSTKYKKKPQIPLLNLPKNRNIDDEEPSFSLPPPSQKPHEQPSPPLEENPRPRPINSFDQAPIPIKKQPIEPNPNDDSLFHDSGIHTPPPVDTDIQFGDPQKQKQSRYNPYLITSSPQQASQQKQHLNKEGVMKALGRPFTSFVNKMRVQSLTERAEKKQKQ